MHPKENKGHKVAASWVHRYFLAAELHPLRLGLAANYFNGECASPTRPLLYSRVRLDGQATGLVVPTKSNPDRLRVRTAAVAEALTVVVVESEGTVRPGVDP